MAQQFRFPPHVESDAGTFQSLTNLPPDHEILNAAIWDKDPVEQQEWSQQAAVEQPVPVNKIVDIDSWVQTLYTNEDNRIHAIERGIRTTDITRESPHGIEAQDHDDTLSSSTMDPGGSELITLDPGTNTSDSSGQRGIVTFGDIKGPPNRPRGTGQNQQRSTPAVKLPNQRRRGGDLLKRERGTHAVIEGPVDDSRRKNEGDDLERIDPYNPHDTYELTGGMQLGVSGFEEYHRKFFGDRGSHLLAIAERTQVHIEYLPEKHIIHLWGAPEHIAEAKKCLIYLNKHADKDFQLHAKKVAGWAKVKAIPDERHRNAAAKLENQKDRRKVFRKVPDPGDSFPYNGAFSWPNQETHPSESLGHNYEALDNIRMDLEVYIAYRADQQCFKVFGQTQESVQTAIDRIFIVFCEVTARNRHHFHAALVHPPVIYRSLVSLDHKHDLTSRQVTFRLQREAAGTSCHLQDYDSIPTDRNWPVRRKNLLLANEHMTKIALQNTLHDLVFLRMNAKLRVHFGTFILVHFRRPDGPIKNTVEIEKFIESVRGRLTKGEVIRDLGGRNVGERLIYHCDEDVGNFTPATPDGSRDINGTLEPVYSTTIFLTLQQANSIPLDLKLEADFEKIPGKNEYRVGSKHWSKLYGHKDPSVPNIMRKKVPLDIKFIDVEREVSYQLDCTASTPLSDAEKPPSLSEFCRHLLLEDAKDGQTKRVSYITLGDIRVTSIITKTKWPYWVSKSPYIFEISKHDHIKSQEPYRNRRNSAGGFIMDQSKKSSTDVRWGASLYSADWDSSLKGQGDMEIGVKANWDPKLDEFLWSPDRDALKQFTQSGKGKQKKKAESGLETDGFTELVKKIEFCIGLIADVKRKVAEQDEKRSRATDDTIRRNFIRHMKELDNYKPPTSTGFPVLVNQAQSRYGTVAGAAKTVIPGTVFGGSEYSYPNRQQAGFYEDEDDVPPEDDHEGYLNQPAVIGGVGAAGRGQQGIVYAGTRHTQLLVDVDTQSTAYAETIPPPLRPGHGATTPQQLSPRRDPPGGFSGRPVRRGGGR